MHDAKPASVDRSSLPKRIATRFLRLNIAKKMLLGYLTLAVLIFVIFWMQALSPGFPAISP